MIAEEQEQAAARIDDRLRQLEAAGFRDVALLSLMVEHARVYQKLIRGAPAERLTELLCRYVGLSKFANLLVRVAPVLSLDRVAASRCASQNWRA